MHRKELNERSPLRVLEQSMHGGLGRGNVGVVIARHGVGKSAFLVGVALDDLMREQRVLHVTLDEPVERVQAFYDDVFTDLARNWELENVWQARVDLERRRRILAMEADRFTPARLAESVKFWREEGQFQPAALIVEGFDFATATADDLRALKALAGETGAELWMSAVTTRESQRDSDGVPEPVAHLVDQIDVILAMGHDGKAVHVNLLKDHDNPQVNKLSLALDPRTMLLVQDQA